MTCRVEHGNVSIYLQENKQNVHIIIFLFIRLLDVFIDSSWRSSSIESCSTVFTGKLSALLRRLISLHVMIEWTNISLDEKILDLFYVCLCVLRNPKRKKMSLELFIDDNYEVEEEEGKGVICKVR